jgi:hypothetical protein
MSPFNRQSQRVLTYGFEEEERQLAAVWAHMKMCAFFLCDVNGAGHLPSIH